MPSASASASSRQGCGMWDVCPSATTGRTRWQRASPRAREEMTLQLKGASLPEGLIVVASNFNMSCLKITGGSAPVHRTLWWCIRRWRPWYDIVTTAAGTTKVDMWRSRGSTPARALAWRLHPLPAAALKVATSLLSALSAIMAAPSHAVLDAIFSNSKYSHFFGICCD
ncbi:uncharacterized protein LOC119322696 isoform X1 [Triticum dicoccoides]|uniref:uncharacterized protein LOC119322696 isoform X1 n=1 Tax=Triticum dicoccoides TaxID=85692 RepID=UPI00188E94EB|nr:uncharacterized protein LOC119322696 isoform X1 [Triticum dicoccoides]